MHEQKVISPARIALCGGLIVLAVVFGLAGIILKHEWLGVLAGISYLGSCLAISTQLQQPNSSN